LKKLRSLRSRAVKSQGSNLLERNKYVYEVDAREEEEDQRRASLLDYELYHKVNYMTNLICHKIGSCDL